MNELKNLDPESEELSERLHELALKFNIPPSILRQALLDEAHELLEQKTRNDTSWIWKTQELFNGPECVRDTLLAKWNNINIVCTLLLTVTVPMGLSPPSSLYSNTQPDILYAWFQVFMFISSTCSIFGVLSNAFWVDTIQTFCPRQSDIVFYVNCGTFDFPLQMMIGAMVSAISGFVALMQTNSSKVVFRVCVSFGSAIAAYFLYQFQKLAIPILRRHRNFLKPFQNASKWVNITEELLLEEAKKERIAREQAAKNKAALRASVGRSRSMSGCDPERGLNLMNLQQFHSKNPLDIDKAESPRNSNPILAGRSSK